ncbi:MAG: iron-containing redox enzyme family protein [Kofleriaceae bacterium]
MPTYYKQETEPIFSTLERYRAELLEHPLLVAAKSGQLERSTLIELAYYQYADSITWIPMLAQMKERALKSRRLRKAIEDNIAHEAGIGSTSHVTLAAGLMRSMGVRSLDGLPTDGILRTASLWLSDAFSEMTEPALAGWLLVAETLVPAMFEVIATQYAGIADTTYFSEHIHVDGDEHAVWMRESVAEVIAIYGTTCIPEILAGMADARDEAHDDPNALWANRAVAEVTP